MRRIVILLCVAAVALSFTARADEVSFASGGKVSGTVAEVTFRLDGKIVTYGRQDISMFYFSPTGQDSLSLVGGKKVKGAIVTVVVKTARGQMTFKGPDLKDISLESDLVAEARRSILATRRAKIAPDDAKGLLELAKWAREKELVAEADALAVAAMKVDLKSDVAVEAHKFLGHVLYDGEWMTEVEMAKRKRIDEGRLPSTEETAAEVAKAKASDEEMDTARLKAAEDLATPAEQNEQACKVFVEKIERSRKRQLRSVQATYKAVRKRLTAKMKKEQDTIANKSAKEGESRYTSVHVRDSTGGTVSAKAKRETALATAALVKLKGQRARLAIARQRKTARITKEAAIRKNRVLAARAAISKKLAAGEEVSLTQMVAWYKKASE